MALTPLNEGLDPEEERIEKVFVGIWDNGPLGSLRSFKVSLPVFTSVAVTLKLSTPSIDAGAKDSVSYRSRWSDGPLTCDGERDPRSAVDHFRCKEGG